MEKNNPISDLLQESMTKLRELADTNSIVGQPIHTPDGVTLIPISRVSLGVGGGGAIFGYQLGISDYTPLIFVLAPGAFFVLGYLMVLFNKIVGK